MLTEQELGEHIDQQFTSTLFRLETLDNYDVDKENEDFLRYLAGQPGPTSTWPGVIRDEVAAGKYTYRVHVVRSPLSDYLSYEFEWCYGPNAAAGEQIRVLDTFERHAPPDLLGEDFWIIDDKHLVRMHYGPTGRFEGATLGTSDMLPRFRAARDAAWSTAVEFEKYWRQHPQYRRDRRNPVH